MRSFTCSVLTQWRGQLGDEYSALRDKVGRQSHEKQNGR
jgi:hypothetical protein